MPNAIAAGLHKRARECSTSKEAGLLSSSDEEQLAFATREGRVLVTRDADFLALAAAGAAHAGIAFWTEKRSIGQLVKDLDSLAFEESTTSMSGRIIFL